MSSHFQHNAKRTVVDGVSFPSQLEASVYGQLRILERCGVIADLRMQSKVTPQLCGACGHQAPSVKIDFIYWDNELKESVWAEAKGVETDRWLQHLKWWKRSGPGLLHIYKSRGHGRLSYEEIIPQSGGTPTPRK